MSSNTQLDRQDLINTAVQFLNMERIMGQPENMKRQFLEKKGLTTEEIETAFKLSKSQEKEIIQTKTYYPSDNLAPPLPPLYYVQHRGFWMRLRDVTNVVIFISGVAFGLSYLYKHFIGPYLTGRKPHSKEESFIELQKSIMKVLQQIEANLERINNTIVANEHTKLHLEAAKKFDVSTAEDIKTELTTIKSLLINKKSFPAAPVTASIPVWQKCNVPQEKETTDEKHHNSEQNGEEKEVTNEKE